MGTIAEKLTYLEGTKSAIKDAIIAKGVEVADTDTFRSYAEKIESIEAGGSCESQSKEINITDNGTRVVTPDEGYLLDQVTVTTNVTTGKTELPNGISFEGSTWTTFDTDPYDWSQVYSGTNMFLNCSNLQTLTGTAIENVYFLDLFQTFHSCRSLTTIPKINGKPYTIEFAFYNCVSINNYLGEIDFSEVCNIDNAFYNCGSWIQSLDFSKSPIVTANRAFQYCQATSLSNFNFSKLENGSYMLDSSNVVDENWDLPNLITCSYMFKNYLGTTLHFNGLNYMEEANQMFTGSKVETITGLNCCSLDNSTLLLNNVPELTNIDGLFNLGEGFTANRTYNIATSSKLTRESCLNIFNTVYDFIGNGSSIRGTLDFHPTVLSLLTEDDIAIATAKGWTVN